MLANINVGIITNASGRTIPHVVIKGCGQQLFAGSLGIGVTVRTYCTTALGSEYVIDATYYDGSTFHTTAGYLDPLAGGEDTLDIDYAKVALNKRYVKVR